MLVLFILLMTAAGWLLLSNLSKGGGGAVSSGNIPPAPSQEIADVAQAISVAEDSDPAWNNPGSLTAPLGFPTVGVANSEGVLKFATTADGWNALYKQLSSIVQGTSRYNLGMTLADFGMTYSGGDPNWAVNVANALGGGITPSNTLGDILT